MHTHSTINYYGQKKTTNAKYGKKKYYKNICRNTSRLSKTSNIKTWNNSLCVLSVLCGILCHSSKFWLISVFICFPSVLRQHRQFMCWCSVRWAAAALCFWSVHLSVHVYGHASGSILWTACQWILCLGLVRAAFGYSEGGCYWWLVPCAELSNNHIASMPLQSVMPNQSINPFLFQATRPMTKISQ